MALLRCRMTTLEQNIFSDGESFPCCSAGPLPVAGPQTHLHLQPVRTLPVLNTWQFAAVPGFCWCHAMCNSQGTRVEKACTVPCSASWHMSQCRNRGSTREGSDFEQMPAPWNWKQHSAGINTQFWRAGPTLERHMCPVTEMHSQDHRRSKLMTHSEAEHPRHQLQSASHQASIAGGMIHRSHFPVEELRS